MKYINEKTGAVLETECEIFGGDWKEESKRKRKSSKSNDIKDDDNANDDSNSDVDTGSADDDKPDNADVKDTGKEK